MACQMNRDFPSPGSDYQGEQADQPGFTGYLQQQAMHGFACEGDVSADPYRGGGKEGDYKTHRLNVNASQHISVCEIRNRGCKPAAWTGEACSLFELAGRESELRMRGNSQFAVGI